MSRPITVLASGTRECALGYMCADSDKRARYDVAGNEPYEFYEVWNF